VRTTPPRPRKRPDIIRQGFKPLPNETSNENLPPLPPDWRWVKLGEVADLNPKLPEAKIPKDESVVQFIPMKLVEEVSGRFHLTETRKYKEVKKGYTTFLDNDVLFAKVTPCMENGKIARVHGMLNGVGFGSTEFHVLRPTAAVDAKYLTHFVVQDRFRNEAERSMTGAVGLRRVPKQFIENHEIPLPPLATQQAIVAKIEELFSELDKGIESIKLAQQLLKTYRQSVLWAGTSGMLTGTHKTYLNTITIGEPSARNANWQTVKLVEAAKLESGHTPRKDTPAYWKDGDVYWLSLQDIRALDGKIATDTKYKTNKLGIENSSARLLPIGTVCFCRDISVGYVTIMGKIMSTTQHFANWICGENLNNTFLMYCFMASRDSLIRQGQGTTVKTIYMPELKEMRIQLPPLAEQQAIVAAIESRLSVADQLEATLAQSLQQAEALRQSVLKQAFEGRLV
jgi:type I restriction enzyme S subunit